MSPHYRVKRRCSKLLHRARDTITFLEQETPDFIPPTLWPPNSPDLNPVDYSIWSVLQEKVYHSKIADVDELKTRLIDEWAQFDQSIVDAAISQRRRRLSAVSRHTGHTSSINSDNFELNGVLYKLVILLNEPHFSLLCAN